MSSDLAYEYILKRLLSGEYAPGAPLLTERLSAEIGVSRTPVREALCKLEADGLVVLQPRLGASVKAMDARELLDLCHLRMALECHAAYLAALNRSEADLLDIRSAHEAMVEFTKRFVAEDNERLLPEMAKQDVRFHLAIITAARNPLIKREILRLHLISRVVATGMGPTPATMPSKADRDGARCAIVTSHEEILAAIKERNCSAARTAMEHHIHGIIEKSAALLALHERRLPPEELKGEEFIYNAGLLVE